MSKIKIGDYVVDEYGHKGFVIDCRGGYVGRWQVRLDSGGIAYKSSRDLTVLISSDNRPNIVGRRLTTTEKVDLLFEYLGLDIEDSPRIVKKVNYGEVSSNQESEEIISEDV